MKCEGPDIVEEHDPDPLGAGRVPITYRILINESLVKRGYDAYDPHYAGGEFLTPRALVARGFEVNQK